MARSYHKTINSQNDTSEQTNVKIDYSQLHFLAEILKTNFKKILTPQTSDQLLNQPPLGHSLVIEFYLLTIIHQFGFWTLQNSAYDGAWYGVHNEKKLRGSDFIWAKMAQLLSADPSAFYMDERMSEAPVECCALKDDEGNTPPLWAEHLNLSLKLRASLKYGKLGEIIRRIRSSENPNDTFIEEFRQLPGYGEDPFQKKLHLLMMYISSRKDNPLNLKSESYSSPAVDYHIMRFLLRFGVIRIYDRETGNLLRNRRQIDGERELAIRRAGVAAVRELISLTGLSPFTVDQFLFSFRRLCNDERAGPDCGQCPVATQCIRDITMFQPLVRSMIWY